MTPAPWTTARSRWKHRQNRSVNVVVSADVGAQIITLAILDCVGHCFISQSPITEWGNADGENNKDEAADVADRQVSLNPAVDWNIAG